MRITSHRDQRAYACNVFDRQTATRSEDFACQESGLSLIFKLIASSSEKKLNNVNVVM